MFLRFLAGALVGGAALLPASPAFGQSAAAPAFQASDVHVSAPTMNPGAGVRPGAIRNGVYEVGNATMLDLIRIAYRIEADKILGGPTWLEVDRFDVNAKVPAGMTDFEAARPLLQTLLADRFKLVVRRETQQLNGWVLSEVNPGAPMMLRAQSAGVAPSCQGQPDPPNVKAVCRSQSMIGFINVLNSVATSYINGPITNATSLTGQWDFDFTFTQNKAQLAEAGAKGISLFDALEKQLGLKLEQKTIPAEMFTVVSVNRTPTANAANIATILPPPPPPEFEVAELKPSDPASTAPPRAQILPTGQINAAGVPLRDMLNLAWGFNSNEAIAGPKWIETAKFDIVGRAFSGVNAQFIDDQFLRLALRKLLVERFQIKYHVEDRPVSAYTLEAGTVKMTKADPAARTRCYAGVPPGARDPRQAIPSRGGLLTCENATMSYFAERLRAAAGGYIQMPIADATGLQGGWNFTLNWSAINLFPGGVNGIGGRGVGDGPASAEPTVPNGAITLPEAVESQLGLRLRMGKRSLPVLVIDSISETPSGN